MSWIMNENKSRWPNPKFQRSQGVQAKTSRIKNWSVKTYHVQRGDKAAHRRQAGGDRYERLLRKQNQEWLQFLGWESVGKGRLYSVYKVGFLDEGFSNREKWRRNRSDEQEGGLTMGHFKWHAGGDVHYPVLHTHVHIYTHSENFVRNVDMGVIKALGEKIAQGECFKWEETQR